MKSKEDWIIYGKSDPFYGVLSDHKYKRENISQSVLDEFYQSGKEYVSQTRNRLIKSFGIDIDKFSIMDFGCGVGRLTLPFAQATKFKVVGIDIAKGMLDIARENANRNQIKNLTFVEYQGDLLPDLGQFDLVNSYIVLQHIEVKIGYQLIDQLCMSTKIEGFTQLHITTGHRIPFFKRLKFYLKVHSELYNRFVNLLKEGRFVKSPIMQMNIYNSKILEGIFSKYTDSIHQELTDHGGYLGAIFYFKRER